MCRTMESTAQVQQIEAKQDILVTCSNCGFSNPDSVQYCWRCGTRVSKGEMKVRRG